MNIDQATIVEILPTEVWYEKDFFGTVYVKMQHQGMEPFTFMQMHYNYMYTSNGHQHDMVKQIGKLLGVEDIQSREWQIPKEWTTDSLWISIEEQKPEPGEWLIYHAPGIFETGPQMWIGQYEDGVFYSKHGFFGGGEVTHWMPLPDLPKVTNENS